MISMQLDKIFALYIFLKEKNYVYVLHNLFKKETTN